MKRMMKRGLSLLLAVLMVVSMLPTSVFAVTFADGEDSGGREETPVLDKNDPVVRPHSSGSRVRYEDLFTEPEASETPEEPDPSEGPGPGADTLWYLAEDGIEVVFDETTGAWTVTAKPTGMSSDTGGGQWMVAIVPDYKIGTGTKTPTEMWTLSGGSRDLSDDRVSTSTNFNNAIRPSGQSAYTGGGTGTYISGSNATGFNSVNQTFTFTSGTHAPALPKPADLRTRLGLADGEQVYVRVFVYLQNTETGKDKAQSIRVPYGAAENPAGVPSTVYVLNKSTGKVTYVSGTIGSKDWINPYVVKGEDPNASFSGTTLTVPIYNDTENVIGVDINQSKSGMSGPSGVAFTQIGNSDSGSTSIAAAAPDNPGYRPAQITVPGQVTSGTITLPVYPYAWDDEGGGLDTNDPLPQATVTIVIMDGNVHADPIVFDIDYGDTSKQPGKNPNIFCINGDDIAFLYSSGDLDDGAVTIANDDWGLDVEHSGNGTYADGLSEYEVIFGTWEGGEVEDEDGNVTDYPAATGKITVTLTPPDDGTLTVSDGPYSTRITLGGIWGAYGEYPDAIFGCVTEDADDGDGDVIIPVIINVHGGTAVFMDGATTVATLKGAPNKQVDAANTEDGKGVPEGSWTRNADGSGTPLTAAQIVLGPRDGSVTYYKVKEVTKTVVKFDPKDGSAATTLSADVPGTTATPPTGYTAGTTKKTIGGKPYVFKGWSETEVAPGTAATTTTDFKYPDSGTKTYYGVWTEQTTITYDVNYPTRDGTDATKAPSAPAADTGDKGRTIDTTASGLQLSDTAQYEFQGWYTEAAGTNAAGASYAANANATLYAKWEPIEHTVTYSDGGETGVTGLPNKAENILHGTNHTISATEPTRTGYTFTGWTSDVSGDTNNYKKDGTGNVAAITVNADITLTAQWQINQYTVTYNKGDHGGSDVPAQTSHNYNTTANVDGTMADSTESGIHWLFKGWSTTKNDASTKVTKFDNISEDKTVYALWAKDTHKLTYHGNDGTLDATAHATVSGIECGTGQTVSNTEPTRDGYDFLGWATSASGTVAYAAGASITSVTSDIDLYAKWQIKTYTVTYDKGDHGGSDVPAQTTHNHGTTASVNKTMNNSTESGIHWLFKGWSTTKNDANTKVTEFANITENKTVYALWEKDTHTVSYDKNGTGASLAASHTSATVNCDGEYTISGDEPTWDANHRFTGWNTASNGTGTAYAKGAKIENIRANITLYAQWEAVVTVTWKTGGGTWSTGGDADKTQTGKTGEDMTTYNGGTDVTRAGYRFKDWTNTVPSPAKLPGTNTTYTAQWDRLYNVVFVLNTPTGATANPASVTKVENKIVDETAGLTAIADDGGNYVFKGWTRTEGGTSADYQPAGTYTVVASHASGTDGDNAKITLYGVWVKKTTVTYNTGAGAWSSAPTGGTTTSWSGKGEPSVDKYNVPADPERSGYNFDGWLKTGGSSVDTGKTANAQITYPAADEVYTAQWSAKKYNYVFNGNGGKWSSDATKTVQYETDAVVSAYGTDPTRTGYTFKGWTAAKDTAPTIDYSDSDNPVKMPANNVEVFALWEANEYEVTYRPGVATDAAIVDGKSPQKFTYDATSISAYTATEAITGTATGWTFKNWLSNETGTPTYNGGDSLNTTKKTAGFTLTAQWQVAVTYAANYPSGAAGTATIPSAVNVDHNGYLTDAQIASPGDLTDYTFDGWYTKADDTGSKVAAGATGTKFTEPTTIYAHWKEKTYSYIFNPNGGAFGDGVANDGTKYKVTGKVGTTITAPSAPTRADYTFQGWATANNAAAADSNLPAATMPSGVTSTEIFAVWQQKEYQYIFNANGGKWTADNATTKTKTGVHKGDSVTKWDTDPARDDYAFKGWAAAADGDTALTWPQTMPSEPTDGKVTVYAIWVPVYDVTYVINGHGTKATGKDVVDKEQYRYTVENPSAVITAGTGESWNGGNTYFTDSTGHWKFLGWKADDASNTVYQGGNQFTLNRDTVLTAQWEETYKVTLGDAVSAKDGTTKLSTANVSSTSAAFNSASTNLNTGAGGTKFVWVKAGDPVNIASVSLNGANTGNYVFAEWKAVAGAGAFGAAGATVEATAFTPTADTTLAPSYWLKPSLSGNDYHHLNVDVDASLPTDKDVLPTGKFPDNTTKNDLPKFEWTQNDADLPDSAEFQIQIGGVWKTPVLGTDVVKSESGGVVTYTFQRSYLKDLPIGDGETSASFKVKVNSNTPEDGDDTTLDSTLTVYVNPEKLTEVNVWAKGGTSKTDTANVEAANNRDQVKYKDHKDPKIAESNKLTYTWYVGASAPDQQSYTTTFADRANSATNAKNAAAAKGTAITGSVDTLNNYVDITGVSAYKGKYIYAVVVASGTGYGAVITNPIAVDYDAVIKVTKDGSATITGGNYTVWLVPSTVAAANVTAANLADTTWVANNGAVPAANQSGTNNYKTADSALTGGKTYDVYVNKVEGNATYFVKTGKTVSTQTDAAANNIPTVEFFSVNAVNTIVKDAEDSTPTKVGETFQDSDKPTTVFTTAGATDPITVTSGNGVFKGSAITAKTSKGDFEQDYHVDWGVTNTEPTASAPLGYNAEADKQTKAKAASDGISVTSSITKKTWAGVQLDQNVYEIKGNIKGTGKVASATLTYKNGETTYTFNGNVGNGGNGDTVTFKVPKSGVDAGAITGEYTISAEGSTDPQTSVLGYSVPSKSEFDQKLPMELQPVSADGTGKFTIFIESSTWSLKVVDDNKKDALTAGDDAIASVERTHNSAVTAANNVSTGSASTTWTKTFANYDSGTTDQVTYTVTVSNPGNTDLKVSLVLKRGTDVIYDASTALTDNKDATNGVTFAGLAASFDLAAKTGSTVASKSFTVTIPADLDNDDDVTYSFEFTSKDANDATIYGPTLTYNLALVVNPIPVKTLAISEVTDYSYTVDVSKPDITFNATNTNKLNATGETVSDVGTDVEYTWYAIPHGATASINATTGAITVSTGTATQVTNYLSDGNRTIDLTGHYEYAGKDLVAVAHGVKNATNYAISGSFPAPRQLVIDLYHNGTKQTGETAPTGHTVYVVPKDGTFDKATAIEATWDSEKDGYTAAVTTGADYDIYANIVSDTATDNKHFQKITTAAANATANPKVEYYSVTINDTTVENTYTGLSGTDYFTTAPTQKPTATVPDKAATPGTIAVTSGDWVVKGNSVTFTYPAWNKDYSLVWSNGLTATDANTTSATNAVHSLSNLSAAATVDTELQLKLYTVTAYVIGKGSANYITLSSTGAANANVFTTKTNTPDANAILGLASSRNSISAASSPGTSVPFSVPKGTYGVVADVPDDTQLLGYKATHLATGDPVATLSKTIAGADNFDVILDSTGIGLGVKDDDDSDPHTRTALWQGNDAVTADITHTEPLDYGYSERTITLTLTNESSNVGETDEKQTVYKVVSKGEDATGSPASGVTWASDEEQLKSDGTGTIPTLEGGDAPKLTLTIPEGLKEGTYTYNAIFTFSNAADGNVVGTLTYILEIVVEPAEFATVNMKYNGDSAALDTTKPLEAGKPLALNTATTTANDVFGSLTFTDDAKDYHYAWYASADNSIATANLSWNATTGAVTFTGGKTATAIGTADQDLSAATIKDHQSEYIYLMIYATASNGKVIKAAISDPVRAGYQGVVQIKENGTLQTAEPKTDGTAKYTVYIMDGATANPTKWDDDLDGYVAVDGNGDPIYLDPTKTYTVKTSAYEGDTTTTALTGASIKGDDLAKNSHIATAEYFTVTAVATTAKHYVDAVGEAFTTMPKAKLSVGAADVDGKTVLKGQNVAAKFDEETASSGVAWTQDYTLTWQEKKDNAADGSSLDDTTLKDTAATAVTSGQTWSNIQTKTYIGGRLDQNVYTITGTIQGSGTVASVVMTDGNSNDNTTVAGGTINEDNGIANTNNDSLTGNAGDTITLKVVKGTYALKANAGDATTVVGVKWNTDDRVSGDSVEGKDVSDDRTFVVYLSAATASLQVADTHTTPESQISTAGSTNTNFKHADHTHEVFFSAMAADEELTVNLKNKGNTDLTLETPTVWKVNAGKKLSDVNSYWSNWTDTANPVTALGTNGAYSETDVITIVNNLTDANKTLKGATTDATGTQLDNGGSVNAATVTIDKKVDVADSGIYILRYTTGDGGPVVYYVLNLVVNQLPIVQVETNNDGSMVGVGDTITAKGYAATDNKSLNNVLVQRSATTGDNIDAATANLTGDDVHFAWVKVAAGTTLNKNNLSVTHDGANDGTLASTVGTVVSQSETYTLVDGDQDKDFYLVAFAPNYTGNVTNAKDLDIADVVKAKRTVGVKVSVDGPTLTSTSDPGYEVYLVESGGTASITRAEDGTVTLGAGTWPTKWNGTTKRYEAPIDMNKTYEVYAVSYLNGTTVLKAIDDTLGKQTPSGTKDEVTVPYFTVSFTQNVAVDSKWDKFASYLPNGAAGSDNAIQEALSVTVSKTKSGPTTGGDKLPASTTATVTAIPVLKDMNVAVTVDATKSSKNTTTGVKKSWSETDVQPLHTLTAAGWTARRTDYADSIPSNADIAVTTAKTFSAKLEQVLFDVTFTVVDNTPSETKSETGYVDPRIVKAKLLADPAKEAATSSFEVTVYGTAATTAGYIGVGTDGDPGTAGATVTFKGIPKGGYEILVSETGNRTKVDGFTWNAADDAALSDPKDPGKIVDTGTTDAVNKHAGNTIQIQYSSYAVQWKDNFIKQADQADGTVGSAHPIKFYNSTGFQKVDTAGTGPFLALKEGYSNDADAVLTYKVQVENTGAMAMEQFWINQTDAPNLIADLTQVTITRKEDDSTETADVSKPGSVTLNVGDIVEFTVTIPSGAAEKDPKLSNYTSGFEVKSTSSTNISKSTYTPAYQVKPKVSFDEGNAVVIYGNNKFEDTPLSIQPGWDTTTYDPDFVYSVLTEDEVKTYLKKSTLADNIYYNSEGDNKLPAWLELNDNTGEVTFKTALHATEVNVKTDGATTFDDYTANEVDNEIVFYIKAVDQDTNEVYYTTYTVDVEPGQLEIVDGDFTYTDDEAVGGLSVDRSKFTYTKVTNMADAPLDVVPALPDSAKHTGAGNDPSQETPTNGKVFVNDGTDNVHTATWTVAPDKYVSEVAIDYVFTVTYKPDTPAEKWNYKPATYTENIEAKKPDMDLLFSDVLGKASYEPDSAELKIGRAPDDGYSPIATDDNAPYAPAAMDQVQNTYRRGEYIVYLDTEPKYVVTLTGIGDIFNVKVTSELNGFKVVAGDLSFTGNEIHDTAKTFTLELAPMSGTTNRWAGKHTAEYTVTGNSKEDGTGDPVKATYKLEITVQPKVIAEAHVTGPTEPTPGDKPSTTITVTAKDPEGEDIKPGTPDKHGNTPIKPDVKWTEGGKPVDPTKNFEDGKDYTVTVTLPADPNYTFEDKDPANDPEPNYTKDGKTDTNDDPTKVDEDLTVTVTRDPDETKQNKEVKLEKTTLLPKKSHLEFEDVNANNANDKVTHAVNAARPTITVVRGEKLGKYNISLGAYDETVTDVVVKETTKNLPTGTVWSLEPANVGSLDKDGKQTYVLDLTGVDTTKNTGAYTLKLTAEGKDPYGAAVTSTYTVTIQVVKAAPPTLMFDDVKQTVAGVVTTDPATTEPKVNDTRTINTIVGGQLGKYTIYLGSYGSTSYDVSVKATPSENMAGVYTLTPDCDTMAPVTLTSCGTVTNAANRDKTKAQAFELDLTGMIVSKTGTYTLKLEAEGTDINDDAVKATYTLTIQVDKAPAGVLRFDDVKTGGDTKDPDALGPDKDLKRLERLENPENPEQEYKPYEVVKGDKLGTYTINLGAYGNTVNDVTVTETALKLPDGTVWALDPARIATMTPGGDKTTYILDLKDVDTAAAELGVYTLKLKAEGTDINGDKTEATYEIAIEVVKAPAPALKFDDVKTGGNTSDPPARGPEENLERIINARTGTQLGKYTINLGAYGGTVSNIKFKESLGNLVSVGVYGVSPDCEALPAVTLTSVDLGGGKQVFELDLSGMDTKNVGKHTLTLIATGVDINGDPVEATYTLTINLSAGGGGGGGGAPACPSQVSYQLGLYGTTKDPVMELVTGKNAKAVPNVNAIVGYKFLGWSLAKPIGDMDKDAARTLVDPKQVTIEGDTVFYAVYQPLYNHGRPFHKHYVIGYPNGNFGPTDNINRASVATIIARAVLPNFVEGADYGNPGNYSDVSGHWAASAIAYCTRYGVFKGYEDGTFRPDQPISRQELVLTLARLSGEQTGTAPFSDMGQAGDWAKGGIYTAYVKGWVNGYTDGTFRPTNPIARDETVKIFNAYLYRGVNAEGLADLTEYVHSGVASNNTENGTTEYMTWPDVPKDQWAYYEIIEAANDHEYVPDATKKAGYTLPEVWTKCWIDEKWRYNDDPNDGGPAAVTMALLRKYGVIA